MERGKRIELFSIAWKARAQPLYQPRLVEGTGSVTAYLCPDLISTIIVSLRIWYDSDHDSNRTSLLVVIDRILTLRRGVFALTFPFESIPLDPFFLLEFL